MVYQLPAQTYFDQKDMIDCTCKNADDWGMIYFLFTLYSLANVYITVENHIFFLENSLFLCTKKLQVLSQLNGRTGQTRAPGVFFPGKRLDPVKDLQGGGPPQLYMAYTPLVLQSDLLKHQFEAT